MTEKDEEDISEYTIGTGGLLSFNKCCIENEETEQKRICTDIMAIE